MSEIVSEDNGFLFDPEDTKAIDIAGFAECGWRAKEAMARGRQHWQASLPDMLHFIAKPKEPLGLEKVFGTSVGRGSPVEIQDCNPAGSEGC